MQLSDLSVRRPVFAAVVAVLLCIVGVVGYLSLSVREYPDTDPPIVSVETIYTGAAASVVETRITQLIEDAVAGVQGIQTITSTSEDGQSDINIEFDPSRDIDSAANDVRDRVAGARAAIVAGARIIVTLIHALRSRGGRRGVAAICIGGGEGTAIAVELV